MHQIFNIKKMNFLELAQTRYTSKSYNGEKISAEKISELSEILRLSPSSINSQPWRFFFVSDEKIKSELAELSLFNKERVLNASYLVVFTAIDNLEVFENQIKENLPQGAVDYYYQFIKPKGENEVKNWIQKQVYLSLGYFLSACASMEIDATPMEGIENEKYDQILNLTESKTLFAVAIGYRNSEDKNQPHITPKRRLDLEKIITNI